MAGTAPGIADLHRRAQLSHQAAARYLDAFATLDDSTTLDERLQRLEQPRISRARRVRALRPLGENRALLSAINHGEFAINGFRNRDLRPKTLRKTDHLLRPGRVATLAQARYAQTFFGATYVRANPQEFGRG